MVIQIRRLQKYDIDFYRQCYSNSEFKRYIYGHKEIDVNDLFKKLLEGTSECCESYIVLLLNKHDMSTSPYSAIGFCNFQKREIYPFQIIKETFAISGGLTPSLINRGYGIYACASMIKLFFNTHQESLLYASTFDYNVRSAKMLTALGFRQLDQNWYGKKHFLLDRASFYYNSFVKKILSHIVVETII